MQKNSLRVFLVLYCVCLFLAKGYHLYNSDNADIIPIYQHMADKALYSGEFYIAEMEKPSSSRYFISLAISLLIKAGLGVEWSLFILYGATFACSAYGFWLLSGRLLHKKPHILFVMLLSMYHITEITFRLGFAGFKFSMPLPSTFAAGLCILAWGFYFSPGSDKRGQRAMALLLCGIAALIQAFVGLFFGSILILAACFQAFIKEMSVPSLIKSSLFLIVPVTIAFLSGMTGSHNPLTPAQIVEILARFRQPHHNLPASWMLSAYLEFLILAAITPLMLKGLLSGSKIDAKVYKVLQMLIITSGLVAAASVFLNYIATSIVPLPFLSKLQSGRAFAPFIAAACLSWGLKAALLLSGRKPLEGLTLATIMAAPFGGLLLLPYMLIERISENKVIRKILILMINLGAVLLIAAEPKAQPEAHYYAVLIVSFCFILPLARFESEYAIKRENAAGVMKWFAIPGPVVLAAILAFLYGKSFICPQKPYPEMLKLAKLFSNAESQGGLFLSDPWLEESLYFRLYSQRGTVVSFKCFPHADDGIREWFSRMQKVGGVSLHEGKPKGIPFSKRTWDELKALAEEYHAEYLLAHKSWFPNAPAKPVAEYGDWQIFRIED